MVASILRALLRLILPIIARVDVSGMENLPARGSYIVAANHLGRLDVPLVYYLLNRKDIIMIVAERYEKYALARWLAKQVDAIFVDRYRADVGAVRKVLSRLQRGAMMVIAPEGTRSKSGALLRGRPGGSYLAAKAGVPVVPVAVRGSEDALVAACLRRFRRVRVTVRIGKPFRLPELSGHDREALLQSFTDEIMCRIAALLPPEYRGFYADHPRLVELLEM